MGLLSSMKEEMCLQMTDTGEVLLTDCALQWLRVETAMQLQPTIGPVDLGAQVTLQGTGSCCLREAHSD